MSVCKDTLTAVREDYYKRVEKYINSLYNKSFEEIIDKNKPLHKVNNIKFLNIKRRVNSHTEFDISINTEGFNKLILNEVRRIEKTSDESINPPLPPASMLPGKPSKNNKYDYSSVLQQKKLLKEQVDIRMGLLKNEQLKEGKSKEQLNQIAQLKELSIKLFKEIKNLTKNNKDLDSFIDNTKVDIDNLLTLMRNPTLENLDIGKKYIEIIDSFVKPGKNGFLDISFTDLEKKRPKIYAKIVEAREKLDVAQRLYEDGTQKILLEKVEHHLKQKEEFKDSEDSVVKEEAKRLIENQMKSSFGSTFNFISKFWTDIENQEEKNVLISTGKKFYDDAIRNNGKKGVEDKLLAIENKVKDRLIKLGHSTNSFFNTKPTWDIFKATEGERLIGVFSVEWQKFKKVNIKKQQKISELFYKFTAENSEAQLNNIDSHYKKLKKEADFIDLRKLPEIISNTDFEEYSNTFASEEESNKYKEELINRIGKREYTKLVKEVNDKVNSFMIEKEIRLNHLFEEYEVSNVDDLQTKLFEEDKVGVWNFFLQEHYTKSPFIFAENHFDELKGNKVRKAFFMKNKETGDISLHENPDSRANLEYSSFIPKDKYKDKKYEDNIKNDDTLREAWELMDELVEYSNQNGNHIRGEKSLDSDLVSTEYKNHALVELVGLLSPSVLRFIKSKLNLREEHEKNRKQYLNSILSKTAKPFAGKEWESEEDRKITGQRVSREQKIEKQYQELIKIEGKKEDELSDKEKESYRGKAYDFVMEFEDETNLIHNIITSSQTTGKFKAKKEVENTLKFLLDQFRGSLNKKTFKGKKDFYEIMELFIDKNLYGINNRGKTEDGKYRSNYWHKVKYYPEERAKIREEIKEGIKVLKKELEKKPESKALQTAIEDLEAMKEDGVLYVNGRDISEAVFFKIKAFTAFAINGSAQVTNMAIASANAYEVDGKEGFWDAGMYTRSMSFARKWKNSKYFSNKEMQKQRKIMDLFLKSADLVQNSANEIYREQTSRYGSAIKEVIKNPINFVGEVEKTIQKPQLLALLSKIEIQGKDGPVNLFNPLTGEFEAFDVDDNGVLVLKDKYNTPHNRDTFLSFNTQEAANIFGESGKIPKAIAYINGDYRDSTTYLAEKYMITAMATMFKRWAVATIYKKAGIYKRLAKNDQVVAGAGFQLLKGAIFATSVGSAGLVAGLTMPMILAAGIGVYTVKNRVAITKILKNDEKEMEKIYKNIKDVELGLTVDKFLKGGATVASMALSTAAHTLLNMPSRFIGRDVVDSDKLKKLIYVDSNNITEKSVDEIKEDLWFLQVSTSLVLRNMIYAAMLHSVYSLLDAGWDDDEEKEAYKERVKGEDGIYFGENTKIDTIIDFPLLSTYYALNNMLASFTDDVSMTENVKGLQRMGQISTAQDVYNIGEAFVTGTEYKKNGRGYKAGDSKFVPLAKRYVIPSSVNLLGFGNKMEKDYNTKGLVDSMLKTNLEKLSSYQEEYKLEAKKKEEEKIINTDAQYKSYGEERDNDGKLKKDKYLAKMLSKFSGKNYPSLKRQDFNKNGTLSEEGKHKIRNYKKELPKSFLEDVGY